MWVSDDPPPKSRPSVATLATANAKAVVDAASTLTRHQVPLSPTSEVGAPVRDSSPLLMSRAIAGDTETGCEPSPRSEAGGEGGLRKWRPWLGFKRIAKEDFAVKRVVMKARQLGTSGLQETVWGALGESSCLNYEIDLSAPIRVHTIPRCCPPLSRLSWIAFQAFSFIPPPPTRCIHAGTYPS